MKPGEIVLEEYVAARCWHRVVFEAETCQIRFDYQPLAGDPWFTCTNEFHAPIINEEEQ